MGDTLLQQTPEETTLLLGIGKPEKSYDWAKIGAHIFKHTKSWPDAKISITTPEIYGAKEHVMLATGIHLRAWKFKNYKTDKKDETEHIHEFVIQVKDSSEAQKIYDHYMAVVEGNRTARDVVTTPPNILYPEDLR